MKRDSRGYHSPWLLAVAAWLLLAGCATAPQPTGVGAASGGGSHEGKAEAAAATVPARPARTVAVVPAQYVPEVGLFPASHAAAEAAAKGAAIGAAAGVVQALGVGLPALLVPPVGIGLVLAYTALGAVSSAAAVAPDSRIGPPLPGDAAPGLREQMVASVIADIGRFTPYGAAVVAGIGPRHRDDVPDYRHLAAKGYGDVVEVAATQVGLAGQGGADPMFTLVVTARARRVDTATGVTTASRGLVYQSPRYTRDEWLREQGVLMRTVMARAQATLAGRIVDDLMLHAEFATDPDAERLPSLCGLAPIDPPPDWRRDPVYERELAQARVASVTPTLAWEARPSTRVALRRRALGACHRPALRPAHLVGRGPHSGRPRLRTRRARRHHPRRRDGTRAPRVLLLERAAALHARRRAAGDALECREPAGVPVRRADGRRAVPRPGVGWRVARTDVRHRVAVPLRVPRLHPGGELPLVPHALNLGGVSPARAASARTAAACR